MSKKDKTVEVQESEQVVVAEKENNEQIDTITYTEKTVKKVTVKKVNDKKNVKNTKKKDVKEKGKFKRKAKETFSELKKVTWPTFGEVCKKTGVVLVVVLIFAVVISRTDACDADCVDDNGCSSMDKGKKHKKDMWSDTGFCAGNDSKACMCQWL